MRRLTLFLGSLIVTGAFSISAIAQTPSTAPKNSVVTGDVVSIDPANVVLKTAEGDLNVSLTDKTEYKRVPPENPVLKAAVPAAFADIGVGDKLLVTGMMSADKKSLPAKSVYLMTKSDIAGRHQKDKERWATRGISGRITAVNQDTKQITVEVRGLGAATSIVLTPKEEAKFRRYAPNSITYSEAVVSKISDISAGDMIRAVGDRSADGASFAAEEIVTGAFQTHAGTVKSVDAAKNEVVITELQSKKDVTVSLASTSILKKFPEQMAQMMAARQAGGGAGGPGGQGGGQMQRPAGGGQGGPGGPGGGVRGGIDDMLERFPSITAADLKVGEMIAISSSKTATLDRITAIKLLAGVEPFVRAAQMTAAAQGRGQSSPSLSIPGLDGFDN
jgi:ribosomal protein L24